MKNKIVAHSILWALLTLLTACRMTERRLDDGLVGAWRGRVQFSSGVLAAVNDLDFMYSFNAGGTMTESSNYDGAPPVPPAYGVWKSTGVRTFRARYEFYCNKAPAAFDEIAKGGGWAPDGHGVLTQEITLSMEGDSFESTIHLELFDRQGHPAPGGGDAMAKGTRIKL